MTRSIFLSLVFHSVMIVLTALSLPFMMRAPVDFPPILSVKFIQITDKTNIPFAAKAAETLEKIKKKEEIKRVVSQQAPPSKKKKEKPDRIPLPEDLNKKKIQIVKKKQNPEEVKEQIRQASEFEKKELFDPNQIAALIDKSKEETAETLKKNKKLKLYEKELIEINKTLWEIEDKIRSCESKKDFNKTFISLSRTVYINNDKRSLIKKKINLLTGSNIIEEKFYKSY